jgi:hypothetical protein
MEIEITLKNYRCFPDTNPAKITLRDGFTSFVGVAKTENWRIAREMTVAELRATDLGQFLEAL